MFFCETISILGACLIGGGLDQLYNYRDDLPTVAPSYIGAEYDVSKFYKSRRPQFYGSGHLLFDSQTKIQIGFDNGLNTEKMKRSRRYDVMVTQLFDMTDNSYFSLSVSKSFGGNTKHTPCRDSYSREYYCGSLTAWSDFNQPTTDNPVRGNITYNWRF